MGETNNYRERCAFIQRFTVASVLWLDGIPCPFVTQMSLEDDPYAVCYAPVNVLADI